MTQLASMSASDILAHFDSRRENLIAVLQEIQEAFRYLPEKALREVSDSLEIPLSQVFHIATFYNCFSLEPVGEHVVQVCMGTACHVRGAPRVLDRILRELKMAQPGTTGDRTFTIRTVRCVGCCGLAPVVRVDDNTHPNLTQAKVRGMLKKYRGKEDRPAATAGEAGDAEARINP